MEKTREQRLFDILGESKTYDVRFFADEPGYPRGRASGVFFLRGWLNRSEIEQVEEEFGLTFNVAYPAGKRDDSRMLSIEFLR